MSRVSAATLLSGGCEETADSREVGGAFGRAESVGDFHAERHHVAFGLLVAGGHGGIVQKAQRVASSGQQAPQQIVSGASRRWAPRFAAGSGHGPRQWRLRLVKGKARSRLLHGHDAYPGLPAISIQKEAAESTTGSSRVKRVIEAFPFRLASRSSPRLVQTFDDPGIPSRLLFHGLSSKGTSNNSAAD